jgi:hypothetical protein
MSALLRRDLEQLQASYLSSSTPRLDKIKIEVLGDIHEDIIQNILPVLFPSYDFVSTVSRIGDCIGIQASLSFDETHTDKESAGCHLKWHGHINEEGSVDVVEEARHDSSAEQAWNWLQTRGMRLY